jgi:hypothetical protein
MQVTPVEDVLDDLELLPLRALAPDRDLYHAMLLQPQGLIEATDKRVGHADSDMGAAMCRAFLDTAVDKHADLVVTPEYCLPWSVVADIVNGNIKPDQGAIWVLGCESITPDDLMSLATEVNGGAGFFYHEPIDVAQKAKKRYIDPLLYVFWCRDNAGKKILSFVVQFKTAPCKDRLDVEQRSLYLGTTVYSFNRGINQIGLLSIICSDAFAFTDLVDEYYKNCLLIHIQLNPKPAHIDYAAYRTRLHSVGSGSDVELLCLNWARGVIELTAEGKRIDWNNVAGSAWYVPPSKFSGDDTLVDDAHRAGLYYSLVSQRWHTFYLNYEPQVLLLQKQKLMVHAEPQVLLASSCLSVTDRWSWDAGTKTWKAQREADDGFRSLVNGYPALSADLPAEAAASPLAVERALELLAGPQGKPSTWYYLQELSSMKVEVEESIRRVTVHQESDPTRGGVIFRRNRLQRAQDAMTLPGKGVLWPIPVRDLEGGFQFQWRRADPHRNVVCTETGDVASLVFLADQSDDASVEAVHKKVRQALVQQALDQTSTSGADLMEAVARATDRLCVVFRRDHVIRVWNPEGTSRFDRPPEQSAVDIAGGEG